MLAKYCYLNGKIIPSAEAKIGLTDIGLLRGYSVFDILRTYHGRPFLLDRHLKRLRNSAKVLNLKVPLTDRQLGVVVNKLLAKNNLPESRIRIVLTGGESKDGMSYDARKPTLFILVEKFSDLPKSAYAKGVKLATVDHQRHLPEAKITNYQMGIKYGHLKKKHGAVELLFTSQGKALEGMGSNIFIFQGDTLITPKKNILLGTTRNFVIELARKKFKVAERDIAVKELLRASECFITSITKDILPVVKIDAKKIGSGKVGKNTKALMKMYAEAINKS